MSIESIYKTKSEKSLERSSKRTALKRSKKKSFVFVSIGIKFLMKISIIGNKIVFTCQPKVSYT